MEDYVYFVYLTINKVNGKMYIGQHKCRYEEQFTDGYLGSGSIIKQAVNKYGKDNFERIILEYAESPEELNELESKYVTEEIMQSPDFYNLKTGGDAHVVMSEEAKEKMSEAQTRLWKNPEHRKKMSERHRDCSGENNPMYGVRLCGERHYLFGKHLPNEIKQKISDTLKGKFAGERHPMWGKKHSNESIEKMRESHKGKQAWNKGRKWSEESKKKMSESHIGKLAGSSNPRARKVVQYTKDGVLVRCYDCIKDAINETGIMGICGVCRGVHSQAGGYVWRYAE